MFEKKKPEVSNDCNVTGPPCALNVLLGKGKARQPDTQQGDEKFAEAPSNASSLGVWGFERNQMD